MNKIVDKLLKTKLNDSLNFIQSKISWGLTINSPKNLTLDELRIWTRASFETQRQIYLVIEEMKWKKNTKNKGSN